KGKRTQIVRADAIRSGKLRVGGGPACEIVLVENAAGNVSTAIADEAARGIERLPIVKAVEREGIVPLQFLRDRNAEVGAGRIRVGIRHLNGEWKSPTSRRPSRRSRDHSRAWGQGQSRRQSPGSDGPRKGRKSAGVRQSGSVRQADGPIWKRGGGDQRKRIDGDGKAARLIGRGWYL